MKEAIVEYDPIIKAEQVGSLVKQPFTDGIIVKC